jgi:hypothetical protein
MLPQRKTYLAEAFCTTQHILPLQRRLRKMILPILRGPVTNEFKFRKTQQKMMGKGNH